jgi:hypothetical protein
MVEIIRNSSVIGFLSNQPKEFCDNYVRSTKKRKSVGNLDKIVVLDLKNSINSFNQSSPSLWIPPKVSNKYNGALSVMKTETQSSLINLNNNSFNNYSSLLDKSGCNRHAARIMLSSYLSGSQQSEEQCWPCLSTNASNKYTNNERNFTNKEAHLSSRTRQYDLHQNKNRLLWEDSLIRRDATAVVEPFREVPNALRETALSQLFLLDNHCYPVKDSFKLSSFSHESHPRSSEKPESLFGLAARNIVVPYHNNEEFSSHNSLKKEIQVFVQYFCRNHTDTLKPATGSRVCSGPPCGGRRGFSAECGAGLLSATRRDRPTRGR